MTPETLAAWYLAGVGTGAGTLAGLYLAYTRGVRDGRGRNPHRRHHR